MVRFEEDIRFTGTWAMLRRLLLLLGVMTIGFAVPGTMPASAATGPAMVLDLANVLRETEIRPIADSLPGRVKVYTTRTPATRTAMEQWIKDRRLTTDSVVVGYHPTLDYLYITASASSGYTNWARRSPQRTRYYRANARSANRSSRPWSPRPARAAAVAPRSTSTWACPVTSTLRSRTCQASPWSTSRPSAG